VESDVARFMQGMDYSIHAWLRPNVVYRDNHVRD
jgi:hypothetical protein